ncbi:sigma D regulator [Flocculibacter collagenilyticus]|uniref:sigma D regulator n=1 Tax=Flocculibacter collagenilyticus TaxID=2744479 RepID=UPI0018F48542|nr:sigma D regulator [Flocculibacter collagenilyticus]
MLTQLEKAQQKWGGVNTAIDDWLAERQDLLVHYCKLAGMKPYERNDNALPEKQDIMQFCQLMMDYVSAGHFEVYDQISNACKENGNNSIALAQSLYPRINQTTDIALEFNDKYAETNIEQLFEEFDTDLSKLGQALEERLELEDELIHNLYTKHS